MEVLWNKIQKEGALSFYLEYMGFKIQLGGLGWRGLPKLLPRDQQQLFAGLLPIGSACVVVKNANITKTT